MKIIPWVLPFLRLTDNRHKAYPPWSAPISGSRMTLRPVLILINFYAHGYIRELVLHLVNDFSA
jgi:hypothetical protein